ncbi:hypothetical protein LEMLEM_LOCUS18633 [Lemmus lemmus]
MTPTCDKLTHKTSQDSYHSCDLDVELSAALQHHVCLRATMLPTMVTVD